jgi:tetratricopeptide (TPR) repeat protein
MKRFLFITVGTIYLGLVIYGIFWGVRIARLAGQAGYYPTYQENLDAARRNPRDAAAQRGLAWHYQRQNDLPKAEFHWRQAVRFQPESRESLYMLAITLQEEEKISEAMHLYQQIAKADETDVYGKSAVKMMRHLSQKTRKAVPEKER